MIDYRALREQLRSGRNEIIERYAAKIEAERPALELIAEARLLEMASEVYGSNRLAVPDYSNKPELVGWLISAAQAYMDNAGKGLIVLFTRAEAQLELIERAVRLEYETWRNRFRALSQSISQ
jgi:hypothetical protein